MKRLVAVDTETNGFPPGNHAVAIAAFAIDTTWNPATIKEFYTIVKRDDLSKGLWNPDAEAVHGITWEQNQAEGMDRVEALEGFMEVVSECDFAIAHNSKFDEKVISDDFQRLGLIDPAWTNIPKFCTLSLSRLTWQQKRGNDLAGTWARLFPGSPLTGHHNALEDAKTCARIYMAMASRGMIQYQTS